MFTRTFKLIFQTSKLNREKFVKDKKLYNESIVKYRQNNYNKIVTRKMSSYSQDGTSFNGGGGGGPNLGQGIIYMFIVAVSCNISSKLLKNANSKKE